jgi:hypothetical protein
MTVVAPLGDAGAILQLANDLVPRRRDAASKGAPGDANDAASWTILRDAMLRIAPPDEAVERPSVRDPKSLRRRDVVMRQMGAHRIENTVASDQGVKQTRGEVHQN